MKIETVTDNNFEAVILQSSLTSVVIVTAKWCAPGKKLLATGELLASAYTEGSYSGRAEFYTVDSDESPEICSKLGIRTLPTTFVFKDGQVVSTTVGNISKDALVAALKSCVAPS